MHITNKQELVCIWNRNCRQEQKLKATSWHSKPKLTYIDYWRRRISRHLNQGYANENTDRLLTASAQVRRPRLVAQYQPTVDNSGCASGHDHASSTAGSLNELRQNTHHTYIVKIPRGRHGRWQFFFPSKPLHSCVGFKTQSALTWAHIYRSGLENL